MHIESAIISTAVATTFFAIQAGVSTISAPQIKIERPDASKAAAAGALVFALQMVNFSIPATGSSGHIVGAVLLASLLGKFSSFFIMGIILALQSLLFADGGLLSFGVNWFNMGTLPALVAYPLAEKFARKVANNNKYAIVAFASVLGLILGASAASFEIWASGIASVSLAALLSSMLFIHLFIGVAEAAISVAALKVVRNVSVRSTALLALAIGGVLSLFASSFPDGLEWCLASLNIDTKGITADGVHNIFASVQNSTALFSDYALPSSHSLFGQSIAGCAGVVATLLLTISLFHFSLKRTRL